VEKIKFTPDTEEKPIEFFIVEQTRIAGRSYLLVTDKEEGDAQALILRDMSEDENPDSLYEIVSDDKELEAVSGVFADMLDDIDFVAEDE
jgi:hypothetical protein